MSWWDQVGFEVVDHASLVGRAAAGVAAPPHTPAGVIRMSREEMRVALGDAERLLDQINEQRKPAQRLTNMRPPADEIASEGYNSRANDVGRVYLAHLDRQVNYLTTLIKKLKKALGIIVENDQEQKAAMPKQGEGSIG
ncbi:hypothetical protein [Amycolatopsis anabasis]|uniref:hypothetical protein n=1 Tax=Amycolatopsis anabasis TaxID=1840409 RepID=UPI00131C03A5|nr:hypothetical protein [Amycolatopsis anabasis]